MVGAIALRPLSFISQSCKTPPLRRPPPDHRSAPRRDQTVAAAGRVVSTLGALITPPPSTTITPRSIKRRFIWLTFYDSGIGGSAVPP